MLPALSSGYWLLHDLLQLGVCQGIDQIFAHVTFHIREHFRRFFFGEQTENKRPLLLIQLIQGIDDIDRMHGLQFFFQLFEIMFLQQFCHLLHIKFSVLVHASHPLHDIFFY